MTIIKIDDLRHAIARALDLGRYTVQFGTVAVGDGLEVVPASIVLDLKGRDDDGFEATDLTEYLPESLKPGAFPDAPLRDAIGKWRPFDVAAANGPTDDHGPSVPAQGGLVTKPFANTERGAEHFTPGPFVVDTGPRVYEFALQDCERTNLEIREGLWPKLREIRDIDAPDQAAFAAADWVHVYDRVTRERRTLKRPEPDAVLKGLRDVAADLRRGVRVRHAGPGSNGDTGTVRHVEEGFATVQFDDSPIPGCAPVDHLEIVNPVRGAPVEPPFGCAALPPVGPLTSTEGLRAGDVLRVIWAAKHGGMGQWKDGDVVTVVEAYSPGTDPGGQAGSVVIIRGEEEGQYHADRFAFVGRPDADGWMTWAGGENPVPGAWVQIRNASGTLLESHRKSESVEWTEDHRASAFRIVDTPPAV